MLKLKVIANQITGEKKHMNFKRLLPLHIFEEYLENISVIRVGPGGCDRMLANNFEI